MGPHLLPLKVPHRKQHRVLTFIYIYLFIHSFIHLFIHSFIYYYLFISLNLIYMNQGPVSERRLSENSEYVNPEMWETLGFPFQNERFVKPGKAG